MKTLGVIAALIGIADFVVPLHHAGPYSLPGRGLVGGLLCFAIAAVMWLPNVPKLARWIAVGVSPVVFFVALYGALAEAEEVIILYSEEADLRLWVVEHEGSEWVAMRRAKAEENRLDGARLSRLRNGETRCVIPRIVDTQAALRRTAALRDEKYAVQRLARRVGVFSDDPNPASVALRFDPCNEP